MNYCALLKGPSVPPKERGVLVGQKKILIVDDEENIRHAIKRVLLAARLNGDAPDVASNNEEQSCPYIFFEAGDGIEAGEKIKEIMPDLVILDIKMPKKDGYGVCSDIRKDPATKHIKIIGISGFSGKIGEGVMEALGADDYFEKPFDNEKLKAKVRKLLLQQEEEAAENPPQ